MVTLSIWGLVLKIIQEKNLGTLTISLFSFLLVPNFLLLLGFNWAIKVPNWKASKSTWNAFTATDRTFDQRDFHRCHGKNLHQILMCRTQKETRFLRLKMNYNRFLWRRNVCESVRAPQCICFGFIKNGCSWIELSDDIHNVDLLEAIQLL